MSFGLGKPCSNCGCFHDEEYKKRFPIRAKLLRDLCDFFDPNFLCTQCGRPVGRLSVGSMTVCPACDADMTQEDEEIKKG